MSVKHKKSIRTRMLLTDDDYLRCYTTSSSKIYLQMNFQLVCAQEKNFTLYFLIYIGKQCTSLLGGIIALCVNAFCCKSSICRPSKQATPILHILCNCDCVTFIYLECTTMKRKVSRLEIFFLMQLFPTTITVNISPSQILSLLTHTTLYQLSSLIMCGCSKYLVSSSPENARYTNIATGPCQKQHRMSHDGHMTQQNSLIPEFLCYRTTGIHKGIYLEWASERGKEEGLYTQ